MALTVAQTADSGAPQAGVTLSELSASVPVNATITTSWDNGATWQQVRGGTLTGLLGSAFVRDFLPALNVPILYRAALSASSAANAVPDPYATNAGEWLSYSGYGGGAGTFAVNQSVTGPTGSSTTAAKKTWTTAATAWNNQGIDVRATSAGAQWPVATSDGRTFSVWAYNGSANSKTFQLKVLWYNGATFLGTTTSSAVATAAGAWSQLTYVLPTTPAFSGATLIQTIVDVTTGTSFWAINEYMLATWAMIAPAPYVFPGYPPATVTSTAITISSTTAWIQDPLNPRSAVPFSSYVSTSGVLLMKGSFANMKRVQDVDVVHVSPRPGESARLPVAALGVRQAPSDIPLLLGAVAEQNAAFSQLRTLLDSAGQLVLRGLPSWAGLDPVVHVYGVETDDPTRNGHLNITQLANLLVTQVRPASMRIQVPWWTNDQVTALVQGQLSGSSTTYSAVLAAQPAGKTYTQWLANPGVTS